MTQPKHTPLPWDISHDGDQIDIRTEKQTVCLLDFNGNETEANAAFIVKACNSHYELLEALENLLEMPTMETARREAGKAIAKAEGGAA